MYVVRRPFRNYGKVIQVGTEVEPKAIKLFKSRLKDRQIVEVTDSTFKQWNKYFTDKFGVSLEKEPEQEPEQEPLKAPIKAPVKVVAKATAK